MYLWNMRSKPVNWFIFRLVDSNIIIKKLWCLNVKIVVSHDHIPSDVSAKKSVPYAPRSTKQTWHRMIRYGIKTLRLVNLMSWSQRSVDLAFFLFFPLQMNKLLNKQYLPGISVIVNVNYFTQLCIQYVSFIYIIVPQWLQMVYQILVHFGPCKIWLLFRNKPLPETMKYYCQIEPYRTNFGETWNKIQYFFNKMLYDICWAIVN